jgi:hypothetical protein
VSTNKDDEDEDPPVFIDMIQRRKKAAPLPEPKTTWRCDCNKIVLAHMRWCPHCGKVIGP